jgi:hypothetical protein
MLRKDGAGGGSIGGSSEGTNHLVSRGTNANSPAFHHRKFFPALEAQGLLAFVAMRQWNETVGEQNGVTPQDDSKPEATSPSRK